MKKSVRSFAMIAVLTSALVPSLRADQTGCNPHPQAASAGVSGSFATYATLVLSFFGA